jgi:hypothetical protein
MQGLHSLVEQATGDTPYVVTPRDGGFDLGLDLADARWHTVLGLAGLQQTYVHQVRPEGQASYTITDVSRRVDWVAGAPGLSGEVSVMKGRVIELGKEKAWGLDAHGQPIRVADFTFSSEEGRQLITLAADQLGLSQRRGTAEMIGLGFAAVAVVGAIVSVVVLLTLFALGEF